MEPPATPSPAGNDNNAHIVDFSVLEAAKENVRPLASGRRATALEQVLTTPHKQRDARLQEQRARFRQDISAALDDDDDPLAVYDEFLKWTLEAYPQGHSAESGLLELLEEVTRVFKDDSRYTGDLRYLKLWVLYASHVEQAAQIYSFLVANEIGTTFALLYEEYALVLERDGRRTEADEIYQLGINRRAQPIHRLKNRYQDFQKRMLAGSPTSSDEPRGNSAAAAVAPPAKKRNVLGNSSAAAAGPAIGGTRTPQPNGRMQIFVDQEPAGRADGNAWPEIGTRKSRVKENMREVTKANETTLKSVRPVAPPTTPKIVPYRDEVIEPVTPSRARADVMGSKGSSEAEAIRRDPLRNHLSSPSTKPTFPKAAAAAPSSSQLNWDPFAPMLSAAAAPTGRRPEKLAIDLDLLFKVDEPNVFGTRGVEWSAQEARARSMGLLGKKWGPPPPSEVFSVSGPSSNGGGGGRVAKVNFNDDVLQSGGNTTRNMGNFTAMLGSVGGGGEPTVTLNTKEALKDVFGMFNSPEKSRTFGKVAGSKHAPLKKVDASTPAGSKLLPIRTEVPALSNENSVAAQTPKAAFKPFVDDGNSSGDKTIMPAFKPFVDEAPPLQTPNTGARRALGSKGIAGPTVPPSKSLDGENASAKAFNVFAPASSRSRSTSPADIFSAGPAKPGTEPMTVFKLATQTDAASKGAFVPFRDEETPLKVFSRPPEGKFAPKAAFTPFVDAQPQQPARSVAAAVAGPAKTPLSVVTVVQEEAEEEVDDDGEDESYFDGAGDHTEVEQDETIQEEEYDEQDISYRAPLGRFGDFNVMTPITERTFEFTATRPFDILDASTTEKAFLQEGATDIAEKLAQEVRDDDGDDEGGDENGPSGSLLERRSPIIENGHSTTDSPSSSSELSGSQHEMSLLDTMSMASHFNPPNPCNPFDPTIMRTLLSLLPPDPMCHDNKSEESKQLAGLQKFSKKRNRRTSGTMNLAILTDNEDVFPLRLNGRELRVLTKLGEGGFGAVFKAKDMSSVDVDDFEEEDEDEESVKLVAVKVVKPRNLWEYHVLRRIHNTLPSRLRTSVIQPQELYAYRDESYLILDLCRQGTLLDLVNQAASAGVSQQGGSMDELLVMFFSIELLRLVEGLHAAGFIHGDLKIDNCMIRLDDVPGSALAWEGVYKSSGDGGWAHKGVKMVDFGRAIHTRVFPANQEFVGDWTTNDRDCIEMREGRPWTYQTDYFGLAGIIYCMLFGKYIEASSVVYPAGGDAGSRAKLAAPFKRYWQTDIWARLFDLLLNPSLARSDTRLPICEELQAAREEMEQWLEKNCNRSSNSLKGLLKKVELFALQN